MQSRPRSWRAGISMMAMTFGVLASVAACTSSDDAGVGGATGAGTTRGGAGVGPAVFALAVSSHAIVAALRNPDVGLMWARGGTLAEYRAGLGGAVTSLSGYDQHFCAVKDGTAFCWGHSEEGAHGAATYLLKEPTTVSGLTGVVTAVDTGLRVSIALANGAAWWWGGRGGGKNPDFGPGPGAILLSAKAGEASFLAAGADHVCAVVDAAVYCHGMNGRGQLGLGEVNSYNSDQNVSGLPVEGIVGAVVGLDAGEHHTCALTEEGAVYCWGHNGFGQLGDGTSENRSVAAAVAGLPGAANAISIVGNSSCAQTGGQMHCWGWSGSEPQTAPQRTPEYEGFELLARGTRFFCGSNRETIACDDRLADDSVLVDVPIDLSGMGSAPGDPQTNPYGPCSEALECPTDGAICPGSSQGCLPACGGTTTCPAIPGSLRQAACLNNRCVISCDLQTICPDGMVCLGGVSCGYN